ncbi:MAG: hypothetical protein V7733_08120 [Paraglaciecola polaris]|uniref:hypothetical protein n=1 Tax=Paraglaciecola polaris TaxID=222814 RepID=UPI003001CD22
MNTLPKVRVVSAADAFLHTAKDLYELRLDGVNWVYPFGVNAGLAIELYLKSYIAEDDDIPALEFPDGSVIYQHHVKSKSKKHRLEQLFKCIPPNIQLDIEKKYKVNELSKKYVTLTLALERFSNIFVECRYPYEQGGFKGGCMTDLLSLTSFFKETIYALQDYVVKL